MYTIEISPIIGFIYLILEETLYVCAINYYLTRHFLGEKKWATGLAIILLSALSIFSIKFSPFNMAISWVATGIVAFLLNFKMQSFWKIMTAFMTVEFVAAFSAQIIDGISTDN